MGVAGGATRAALVQHQARRDNMADVSAKDGSQVSYRELVSTCINAKGHPLCSSFSVSPNVTVIQ